MTIFFFLSVYTTFFSYDLSPLKQELEYDQQGPDLAWIFSLVTL